MAYISYKEKLKDPRWQKKRLEILSRDNFKCKKCGDEESTLHVHHYVYLKGLDPWEYKNRDLDTLCKDCHNIIHHLIECRCKADSDTIIRKNVFKNTDMVCFISLKGTFVISSHKNNKPIEYIIIKKHLKDVFEMIGHSLNGY